MGSMPLVIGQQIEVMLIKGGMVLDTITDVKSADLTWLMEILKVGFLGETTDRRDEVFHGVKGKLSLHFEDQQILVLARDIVQRARTRVPGTQINIKITVRMSNGDRPVITVPDAKFGEIPLSVGGRTEFAGVELDFEAEDARLTLS
jgi:hypothetical protein